LKTSSRKTGIFSAAGRENPNQTMLEMIAQRFRAMGEPMRLRLLVSLQQGERSVGDLVREHDTSQANVSKHLQVLTAAGLSKRRKQGLRVLYSIADPDIFYMCDRVCGS
jgi:ArsR family transcriptional regulator